MAESWAPIFLSAKVFGHLSQGLYRTPAGAIKELISNSFDADARIVRIHTGYPSFETFSCEDNGSGMSVDEFHRLMNRGIGTSEKRTDDRVKTDSGRQVIGRLGLGILALAQVCTQFDIISHHRDSKSAFRATIKFPPYTRAEMDKIKVRNPDEAVRGGEYRLEEIKYDSDKRGLRVYTRYLREPFRKQMASLERLAANKKSAKAIGAYTSFEQYLGAIFDPPKPVQSLNLISGYDQLLFGLAMAAPLPFLEEDNVAVRIPSIRKRQRTLVENGFQVRVDNLNLAHPVRLPSDREGHTADVCRLSATEYVEFTLQDGPHKQKQSVRKHTLSVEASDEKFSLYELDYQADKVAGMPLKFSGYLFQQTGRLFPRDIQGLLIRINNVAIGRYDNSLLTYPYAEGPRYSMVSGELFIDAGFEDALNIDRDSFNELHPHYMRLQSYVHGLLHTVIFPETWGEEKRRNKVRKERKAAEGKARFEKTLSETTGERARAIRRVEDKHDRQSSKPIEPAVEFGAREIKIHRGHPALQPVFRRKKHGELAERIVIAFETANAESKPDARRELFYKLLAEILADL